MYGHPGNLLESLCSGANNVLLVAPYMKADLLSRILEKLESKSSLICVTRWNLSDFIVGVSDLRCHTIVSEFGGSFMIHPTLHAKYYRFDDAVLIGSANLTSSAMGWSPQPNLEILCHSGDYFDNVSFESTLFKNARTVTDEEFLCWEAAYKIPVESTNTVANDYSRLSGWMPTTRDPKNLNLSYRGRHTEIASFDEQRATMRDLEALSIPPNMGSEEVRTWVAVCLLSTSLANTVIRMHTDGISPPDSYRSLATTYNLDIIEARRSVETIENWLAHFAPEVSKAMKTRNISS